MASLAQTVRDSRGPFPWFWNFLKEELAPYPGRASTVARMVIAATIIMTICMAFRIPFAFQATIFALLISRENFRSTVQASGTIFLYTCVSAAYVLVTVRFVVSEPILHFFWILCSFFLAFFALSAATNYLAASVFAIIISIAVPLWDRHVSAETNVEDTLRALLAVTIAVAVTTLVELQVARLRPGDSVVLPLAERLAAVQGLLTCYAEEGCADLQIAKKVANLTMVGTSLLRRLLRRSNYSSEYTAQMSGVISLVSRLVDLAGTVTELSFVPSATDRVQLRNLAATIASLRLELIHHRIPAEIQFHPEEEAARGVPLLDEMAHIVALIPQAFAGSQSIGQYLPPAEDTPPSKLLVADAFTNSDHMKFGLKGCLAASACYVLYNSIAWPGISTSVTTCLLTALSTIGASRQKQVLRLAGAVVGGFLIGMGSQVFILPHVDSIAGFAVLFVLVTAPAAWILTSSPRLSYFGLQVALAFYLINVQEFAIQTSLAVARDRVVGVLLGLFMMWLVFDQLWSAAAGVEMKQAFLSTLRLLAQLAREPVSPDPDVAIKHVFALRHTISAHFDSVRSLADGVLFEFGPTRRQDLALRDHIRRWQPPLRALFLMRVASIKYRVRLPGFELPDAVLRAQQAYDEHSARVLEDMADRMEDKTPQSNNIAADSLQLLEHTIQACSTEESKQFPEVRIQTFVTLMRRIDELTTLLAEGITT
jgi:multidrug resistance protein MdtO